MLTKHYSPRARVVLRECGEAPRLEEKFSAKEIAVVWLKRPAEETAAATDFWLSEDGGMETVARNVFGLLRQLDQAGFREVHMELAEEKGLGAAVNDRLRRAAARA